MIDFECPFCRLEYHVPDAFSGRTHYCGNCRHQFTFPMRQHLTSPTTTSRTTTSPLSGSPQSSQPPPQSVTPPIASPRSYINYTCPHCGADLEVESSLAGDEATCGICKGRTIVPNRRSAGIGNPATSSPQGQRGPRDDRRGLYVPVLISAIGNLVVGLLWAATGCGIVLAIPMFVLSIFEFVFYSEADRLAPIDLAGKAGTIGIFEILCGLFNIVSFVCGIILLINKGKYERALSIPSLRSAAAQRQQAYLAQQQQAYLAQKQQAATARAQWYRDRGITPGPFAWFHVIPDWGQAIAVGLILAVPIVVLVYLFFTRMEGR
jgi:transcription elongation factor Elf1